MDNYQNLEQQVRTLRRRITGLAAALILTVGYIGLSSRVRDVEAQSVPQELTLRRLTIVDEKGRPTRSHRSTRSGSDRARKT